MNLNFLKETQAGNDTWRGMFVCIFYLQKPSSMGRTLPLWMWVGAGLYPELSLQEPRRQLFPVSTLWWLEYEAISRPGHLDVSAQAFES